MCVCVLYLMNECLLESMTLKASQAALTYYISTRTVIFAAPSLQQLSRSLLFHKRDVTRRFALHAGWLRRKMLLNLDL